MLGPRQYNRDPVDPLDQHLLGLSSHTWSIDLETKVNESANRHILINRVPRAPRLPGNLGGTLSTVSSGPDHSASLAFQQWIGQKFS